MARNRAAINGEIQRAIRALLVERLGYTLDVDPHDRRLHEVLGDKDAARAVRTWAGGYTGASGSQQRGRAPRDSNAVRQRLGQLIEASNIGDEAAHRAELERICAMIDAEEPCVPACTIIDANDINGIVSVISSSLERACKMAGRSRLDVVTRKAEYHQTTCGCLGPMVERLAAMAKAGKEVSVRLIEQGGRMSVQPDQARVTNLVDAVVCGVGEADSLTWHGSIISTPATGPESLARPVAAILGWKNTYHVLDVSSSNLSAERELTGKLADFERTWKRIEVSTERRTWGASHATGSEWAPARPRSS